MFDRETDVLGREVAKNTRKYIEDKQANQL